MNNIAILGSEKTYSDKACQAFELKTKRRYHHLYFKSITETMIAVNSVTLGVLPIENTLEGFVQQHLDLLIEYDLTIIAEIDLHIDFAFVSHKPLKDTLKVYVQYAAKNQCLAFLNQNPQLKTSICESNSDSYENYIDDPLSGAIIPKHLLKSLKCDYSIDDIADESLNQTRFFIVKSQKNDYLLSDNYQNYKVFIAILPDFDRPGLLLEILDMFAKNQINLLSIMSRPTKKQIGNYRFFIEMESSFSNLVLIKTILNELNKKFHIKLLGIYPNIENQ
ncbi:MAG: prephenate dehydratase [Tenericutes bacterium HGW-Tenericutes-1]|jgi:prephenate dehydratase|nr:MAG: prephenate dehydratase [Tenericutes bacterium HGW-Tenericutes-1]